MRVLRPNYCLTRAKCLWKLDENVLLSVHKSFKLHISIITVGPLCFLSLLPPSRRLYFHRRWFLSWVVFQIAGYAKTTQLIFTKFGRKAAYGQRKKPLDLDGNQDHVTLGTRVRVRVGYGYG